MADPVVAAAAVVTASTAVFKEIKDLISTTKESVKLGIIIHNKTGCKLTDPVVRLERGSCKRTPCSEIVAKEGCGCLFVVKDTKWWTGSSGTVSWLIEGKNRRVVIMWAVPLNQLFYSNHLAVALTTNVNHAPRNEWS